MAAARFQVVSLSRSARGPTPREPTGSESWTDVPPLRTRGFTWRFMSANNRSLARSAHACPDVESCLAAIRALQECLPEAVAETSRNGDGQWVIVGIHGDQEEVRAEPFDATTLPLARLWVD